MYEVWCMGPAQDREGVDMTCVFVKSIRWVHYGKMRRMGYHAVDENGTVIAVAGTILELISRLKPEYRLQTGAYNEVG